MDVQKGTYNFGPIERKWQEFWAEHKTFRRAGLRRIQTQILRAGHVPVSERPGSARGAPGRLHGHRYRRPLQADERLQRAASHWLGCLWSAGRAARDQNGHGPRFDDREEYRQHATPNQVARLQLRLGPRDRHDRSGVLQVDAVDLPEALQQLVRRAARRRPSRSSSCRSPRVAERRAKRAAAYRGRPPAGVPGGRAGELVPGAGHGAGQRGSDRRHERAGRASRWYAGRCGNGCCGSRRMPTACWRTWSCWTGRSRIKEMQRNWIGKSDGAEVDFEIGSGERSRAIRGLHHPAGHAVRRDLHGAGAGASAGGAASRRPTQKAGGRRLPRGGRPQERSRPHGSGQGEDRRLHRRVCRSIR